MVILLMTSCGSYDECPEITKGYASKFILPDPTMLTDSEKEYVEELRDEYNESIAKE